MNAITNDLNRANAQLLREARALRDDMERLIARLDAGGSANPMDTLGSRPCQFESALGEVTTLNRVLFHLSTEDAQ